VIVESGELRGSGNIWKAEKGCLTVITAAHVIEDEENVSVTLPDGQTYRAETKLNDVNNDYCFLEVRDEKLSLSSGLKCAEELPAASESVFMVVLTRPENDNPEGAAGDEENPEALVSAGVVISPETYSEDLSRNVLCCDIEVAEGMSGGGLFDAEGNYLGLLLGRSADGLGVFIPVSDIEQ
jgi:S1-C subfamily serine protease